MNKIWAKEINVIFVLSIILIILFSYAIKLILFIKNDNRIKKYTLKDRNSVSHSIIDDLLEIFWKVVKKISKLCQKSNFLKKYADSLDGYLIYEKNDIEAIDFISIKFISMFSIQMLYLFVMIVKLTKFYFMPFLAASIIGFMVTDIILIISYKEKKKLMEEQLLQAVVIMNSAFKSGKTIRQAIDIVKKELPSPIKEEFITVSKDLNYGLDLETVFTRFASRVKVEEAGYITSSLSLLNKTGGNIVTVFNMIENNFYERLKIKNELNALTMSSRYMYKILLIMPVIFIGIIVLLNPDYFKVLLTTSIGHIVDIVMISLYLIYIFVVKKIMKVDSV